jgi:hypothetical protein
MLQSTSNRKGERQGKLPIVIPSLLEGIRHPGERERGVREEAGHDGGPGGGRTRRWTGRRPGAAVAREKVEPWRQVEAAAGREEEVARGGSLGKKVPHADLDPFLNSGDSSSSGGGGRELLRRRRRRAPSVVAGSSWDVDLGAGGSRRVGCGEGVADPGRRRWRGRGVVGRARVEKCDAVDAMAVRAGAMEMRCKTLFTQGKHRFAFPNCTSLLDSALQRAAKQFLLLAIYLYLIL